MLHAKNLSAYLLAYGQKLWILLCTSWIGRRLLSLQTVRMKSEWIKERIERIQGSEAFTHIPKEQRSKWDKKSKKLIFVGYQRESSNYCMYLHTGKIIVSCDVKFDESQDKKITLTSDNITLPLGNDSFPNDPRANESLLTNRTIGKRQQQREFWANKKKFNKKIRHKFVF